MDRLQVNQIDVSYGKTQVVNQVSFNLGEGQIGCLLGPSGCGKTTVLLAIAGFQQPTSGQIIINGQSVSDGQQFLAPEKRKVGMVFQDFALFPNLSVEDNIGFGIQSLDKPQQEIRIAELLELIGLTGLAKSYPHQLSGGQQQRVALARAMAPKPSLLLLDEPFSNLDVELREQLASEVRQILKKENVSAILVTHDQHEAFAMADDICVMHEGKIQQQDTAQNLYQSPANQFVAGFIGDGVLLEGKVLANQMLHTELGEVEIRSSDQYQENDLVDILIRPNDIEIDSGKGIQATVLVRTFRGSQYLYQLQLASGSKLLCLTLSEHYYEPDDVLNIRWQHKRAVVFKHT